MKTIDTNIQVIIKCKSIFRFILIALCLQSQLSVAQTATASAKEKEYLIGDWVPIDLFVSAGANNKVVFPNLNDTISETIEVANYTPVDTIKKNGLYEYHQLVNLIVFDTGNIRMPQFEFLIDNRGGIDTIVTTSFMIHVAGVKIDTTKDIIDIKEPLGIPLTFKEVLPFIIGALVLAILTGLIIWYLMERKKKKLPLDEKFLLPPHVWAFKELDKLQQKKLWQNGEVKSYYSELTDIARTYIELRYKIPAMEKTTDELMSSLHKGILKQSFKQELNEVLSLSDFVKFAKAQPDFMENESSLKIVRDFIDKTKPIEQEKSTKEKS